MSRKLVGLSLMFGGGALMIGGLFGWITSSGEDLAAVGASTTPDPTSTVGTTTTLLPTTTSTKEPITTTVPPTTTTTIDIDGEIGSFVKVFADAIAREDVDLLVETLHPAVISLFDETTCRTFISEEILLLKGYRLIGQVEGPTTQSVAGMTVQMYSGPVAFTFQGQDFTSDAAFAFEGSEVRWFTQCGE